MPFDLVAVDDVTTAEAVVAAGGRVVVHGDDAEAVGRLVARLDGRGPGRAAGFVGTDLDAARAMGDEVFARS